MRGVAHLDLEARIGRQRRREDLGLVGLEELGR